MGTTTVDLGCKVAVESVAEAPRRRRDGHADVRHGDLVEVEIQKPDAVALAMSMWRRSLSVVMFAPAIGRTARAEHLAAQRGVANRMLAAEKNVLNGRDRTGRVADAYGNLLADRRGVGWRNLRSVVEVASSRQHERPVATCVGVRFQERPVAERREIGRLLKRRKIDHLRRERPRWALPSG